MQQTETYNLNIIETDDTFSPDALNANARTLETQLARIDAAAAALAATVPKFTCGAYVGDGKKNRMIELPFTPQMVYVGIAYFGTDYTYNGSSNRFHGGVAVTGVAAGLDTPIVEIVDGGFRVSYISTNSSANSSDSRYRYFALA